MRDVYVTAVSAIAPGIGSADRLVERLDRPEATPASRTLRLGELEASFFRADLDPADPHLPTGRETKIMRRDVALGVVCAARLLAPAGLGDAELRDSALYVATGLCQDDALEGQVEELCTAYVEDYESRSEAERNQAFFRALPPLMALAGLSNAAACFIARECRVRGPNAVFGVGSHAGHAAAREGVHAVASGRSGVAVVGGANSAGTLSALALAPLADSAGGLLREAEASAFLLLESEESLRAGRRRALARITNVGSSPWLPGGPPAAGGAPLDHADVILHGGSVFEADARASTAVLEGARGVVVGWFGAIGCAGAASVALDLATAARMLSVGRGSTAICVNRDVHGRESWIALEAA